ncbi:MAG: hypothetical protein JSR26_08705 [Proteobacteria bacterium]|nr:hypothetical protein [Pseudomonadota bacterium]
MQAETTKLRALRPGILGLAVTCALAMAPAGAVGLGGIEVQSKLNEPFVAEIPLNVDYRGQLDDMVVHMASPEAFEAVGLQRPHDMSANLVFKVTRNARGEAVVRVTTPQKMTDPYVSFLLEVEWGNGKMVREYTAMLEPPHVVEVPHAAISAPTVSSTPMPAPTVSPPVVKPVEPQRSPAAAPASPAPSAAQQSATPPPPAAAAAPAPEPAAQPSAPEPVAPMPAPEPVASTPPAEPAPPPAPPPEPAPAPPLPPPVAATPPPPPPPAASAATGKSTLTVDRGQTLSSIAGQMQTPGVSLNRVMIALQRANPDAFVDGNINRLKAGAELRVPDAQAMAAITPDEANALVHEQVESWRHGAQPTPQLQPVEGAAAATAHADDAPSTPSAAAAPRRASARSRVAGAGDPPGQPRGARLEILPPAGNAGGSSQSGSSRGGSGSEVRAELAQNREDLASRQAEIKDLKAHVADLEKIKADSQKLLSLKDSQMAALQARLAELEKKDAQATASPASSAAGSPASSASAASPSIAAAAEAAPASSASAAPAAAVASPAAAVAATPAKAATPAPVHPAPPPPEGTPWYLRPFVLIGGGLLLFAGLLGLMLRRPAKEEPEPRRRNFDVGELAASLPRARAEVAPIVAPVAHEDVEASKVTAEVPILDAAPPVVAAPTAASQAIAAAVASPVQPQPASAEPVPPTPPSAVAVESNAVAVARASEPGETIAPVPEPPREPAPRQESAPVQQAWDMSPQAVTQLQTVTAAASKPAANKGALSVPQRIAAARTCIENGDIDNARALLEAALIDGNAAQQEEAFSLLDMIDSW